MPKLFNKFLLILLIISLPACTPFFFARSFRLSVGDYRHLTAAEELSRQGEYDEAIAEYRAHIAERLSAKERPNWENPHFYLILIGDIQLGQGKAEEALETYQKADQNKVDPYLISDRMRGVAAWYEKKGDLNKAVEVLRSNRTRDILLYDAMLDRLAREITRKEDEGKVGDTAIDGESREPERKDNPTDLPPT